MARPGPSQLLYRVVRLPGVSMAVLSFGLFAALLGPVHASEWQPVLTTADGIQVFRKDAGTRGLIEFRGVGVVEAPLSAVASVIFDTGRRTAWIDGLVESRILRWGGADTFVEYDHIELPLFFSDREFVSQVRIRHDPSRQETVFQFRPADDPSAPANGSLRGEMLNMTFLLRSIENGRMTMVDAEVLCDPKGWIPAWLVNVFLRDWPMTTFRNLRQEIRQNNVQVDPRFSGLLEIGMAN